MHNLLAVVRSCCWCFYPLCESCPALCYFRPKVWWLVNYSFLPMLLMVWCFELEVTLVAWTRLVTAVLCTPISRSVNCGSLVSGSAAAVCPITLSPVVCLLVSVLAYWFREKSLVIVAVVLFRCSSALGPPLLNQSRFRDDLATQEWGDLATQEWGSRLVVSYIGIGSLRCW